MPLASGSRLGPFQIVDPLGAGGMGQVYRAKDTRLDRLVALKVVHEHDADDDRRARFEREARAVAALNHPNICTLHDVGIHDGVDYLVMELLDGETLEQRLARGPMAFDGVLSTAIQIADALAAAHRAGIVHRDLKPSNVMLTRSGVKLLDFGLAKANRSAILGQATETVLTGKGEIVGTLQYMAPEQLEGKPVDARTDVFALGVVVFEMAAGRPAFAGDSPASLIGAILHEAVPPLASIAPAAPPALQRIIDGCVAKAPDDRWSTAHDVLLQLRGVSDLTPSAAASAVSSRGWRAAGWTLAGAAALLGMIAGFALAGGAGSTVDTAPGLEVWSVVPPPGVRLEYGEAPQLSPDGRMIALVARDLEGVKRLYVRRRDAFDTVALPETEDATLPFWAPDSRRIGFFAGGRLKTMSVAGGGPQILARASVPRGGSWNRNDEIVFVPVPSAPLQRVSATGGNVTQLPHKPGVSRWFPSFLPDGRHYLFLALNQGQQEYSLRLGRTDDELDTVILDTRSSAVFAPPGHLLFRRDNALFAQAFDDANNTLTGTPRKLADDVGFHVITNQTLLSAASDGSVAFVGSLPGAQLGWFDADGRPAGVAAPPGQYNALCLTPDGSRLLYEQVEPTGNLDLWALDTATGGSTRVTFDRQMDFYPVCGPGSDEVTFASLRLGPPNIYRLSLRAPGSDALIVRSPQAKIPTGRSSDGALVVYSELDPETHWDIKLARVDGSGEPTPFAQTDADERGAKLSPDDRWMAYVSDESGRPEVYVQPFPSAGTRWQISKGGGQQPSWQQDGRRLFFLGLDRKLYGVDVQPAGATFATGVPRLVADLRATGGEGTHQGCQYALMPDGRIIASVVTETAPSATVVRNWLSLMNR